MDLTVSYGALGREQEALEAAEEVLRIDPEFSIERYSISINMMFKDQNNKKQSIDALRKAGLLFSPGLQKYRRWPARIRKTRLILSNIDETSL